MIAPMKKYAFLVYHKEYEDFLKGIQELGVVHVIEKQSGIIEDETTRNFHLQLTEQNNAIKFLDKQLSNKSDLQPATNNPIDEIIGQLHLIQIEQDQHEQRLAVVSKEISQLKPWGDFSWDNIYMLQKSGWKVSFYSCPSKKVDTDWSGKFFYSVIGEVAGQSYFITLSKPGEAHDFDLEEIKLPERSLSVLQQEESTINVKLKEIETQYEKFAIEHLSTLQTAQQHLITTLDFKKVVLNTQKEADDKLMLLEGWVPVDSEKEINEFLNARNILFISERATKEDPAPVKLRNSKFAKLFQPITELYEMPAYAEVDLTPFFAPFFVMFFGLCLGDAGYGVLLLIISLIAKKKVAKDIKPIMTLVSILGVGTIVFGFMSGTLFGIELLKVDWPWIQKMKSFMLNSDQLFKFSLMIGGVQILFGMFIKAVGQTTRYGFKNALSAWGWLVAIIGGGGTFALQHFGFIPVTLATILYYIIGSLAAIGIFVLNDIKRNPIINIGAGLWDSYNMATGLLGDILSYVRLFALGISGAVLGLVFNDLAMKMSPDIPVVGFLVSAIILIFGHGMNIFMSGLGAFVHPLRLTFVEFYKNSGFEGGGKKYTPFK